MAIIRNRNPTSHTYNPELAHQIADLRKRGYAPALEALQRELQQRAKRR